MAYGPYDFILGCLFLALAVWVWWSIWSWERADRKACREEQAYWKEWRRRKLREWKLRGR